MHPKDQAWGKIDNYKDDLRPQLEGYIKDYSLSEGGIKLDLFSLLVPAIFAAKPESTLVLPFLVVDDHLLGRFQDASSLCDEASRPYMVSMTMALEIHGISQCKNCLFVLVSAPRNAILYHATVVWLSKDLLKGRYLSSCGDDYSPTKSHNHKLP